MMAHKVYSHKNDVFMTVTDLGGQEKLWGRTGGNVNEKKGKKGSPKSGLSTVRFY